MLSREQTTGHRWRLPEPCRPPASSGYSVWSPGLEVWVQILPLPLGWLEQRLKGTVMVTCQGCHGVATGSKLGLGSWAAVRFWSDGAGVGGQRGCGEALLVPSAISLSYPTHQPPPPIPSTELQQGHGAPPNSHCPAEISFVDLFPSRPFWS